MSCPFCERKIKDRIFFEEEGWMAFLAAPYHTKGHTILAAKPMNGKCPVTERPEDWSIVKTFGSALAQVAGYLVSNYQPKDVLFSSLRGHERHFHCHLIPLWECEEKSWRKDHLYESGHLMEFLGYLEKTGDERAVLERCQNGWDVDTQRKKMCRRLEPDIKALQSLTGYQER